jgi:hypothetical protein
MKDKAEGQNPAGVHGNAVEVLGIGMDIVLEQ